MMTTQPTRATLIPALRPIPHHRGQDGESWIDTPIPIDITADAMTARRCIEDRTGHVQRVAVADIVTWEPTVSKTGMLRILARDWWTDDDGINGTVVAREDGSYLLMDGNHRIAMAILSGITHVIVAVF